ncbi:PorT protein [Dokdonia pacifica]|uniref:Probable protein-translocating porin PorT n=1 Tax=Dokdonia pacifica TaxID=1627892 RepID=A0A239C1R2_9FLAO|nr:porin family protein [Dokdonia pacifica]GGG26923.1 PorT protein [Dokdonia pacifica]SNS14187.1 probable protein-translocating porin PorT [Dokdonia pacifica]
MRVFIVIVFFLAFTQVSQAQWLTRPRVQNNQNFDKAPISWGYYLGFNSLDYNFDYIEQQEDVQVTRSIGFNVGLIGNLRLSEYVDLRTEPGLSFTRRDLMYAPDPRFDSEDDLLREVPATYIYVPLLLKFNTKRLNNVRPFVTVGVSTTINLSSNEKNPDDNFAGQFRTTTNPFFYEVGFGIDLYLPFFKFTPSIRGIFATSDELVRDNIANSPWTGNISKLSTRGIFLNFTFQ